MPAAPPPSRDVTVEARFFWERFKNEIVAIVLLAVAGIIGFGGYRFYSDRRDSAASALLARAKTIPEFQEVIAHYPSTPAGADAYLLLADAQRQEKKFADANATLQVFIDKNRDHQLVTSAYLAMASNLEAMGKTDDAFAIYQKTAASYPKSFNAPLALLSQVQVLRAKNKIEDARLICEKILTDYRESFWASEAARQLRTLKPPPSAEAENAAPAATAPTQPNAPSTAPAPPAGAPTPRTGQPQ